MSLLAISGILGLFFNTLTADDKYSCCNSKNLRQPIEMQLSKKEKIAQLIQMQLCEKQNTFINFLLHF